MTDETSANIRLCNGKTVDCLFLDLIKDAISAQIPKLQQHKKYTLRRICGESFWKQLEEGDQEKAGWCMSHLVSTHQVPMIFTGKNCHNANTYQCR